MEFLYHLSLLFILTFISYYLVSNKYKIYVLLGSSLIFISVFSLNVAIFSVLFCVLNYFLGLWLEKVSSNQSARIKLFWLSIFLNVGILAFFKYAPDLTGINTQFFDYGSHLQINYLSSVLIPLGISYYTFQSLGYIIRINRGSEKAERNFGVFATYLLFFPKFLSGPVSRSNQLLPQLNNPGKLDQDNIKTGGRLFLWGLFKKVVIADNLYGPVSAVYSDVHHFTGITLIIILIVQTVYIYCDFSGYTDMALGAAKFFGINLADNFNRPFLAKNISEFWRRWHISLSSWCNDFIYNPFIVKYRRLNNVAVVSGIFLTFFIVGIWHGANWTFVVLGLLQGAAIVYEFYTKKRRLKIAAKFAKSSVNTFSRIMVFLFMSFSMVFFFSYTIGDAWHFVSHMFTDISFIQIDWNFISNKPAFVFGLLCFAGIFAIEMLNEKGRNLLSIYLKQPFWFRWAGYIGCLVLIYIFNCGPNAFYYMRF